MSLIIQFSKSVAKKQFRRGQIFNNTHVFKKTQEK